MIDLARPIKQLKKHLPVAIVIDKSRSTEDVREDINQCTRTLIQQMKDKLEMRGIVELLVVFFNETVDGGKGGRLPTFVSLDDITPDFAFLSKSEGATHTGRALKYTIRQLEEKKEEWRRDGEDYYQPLLYLLTDGYPDAGENAPPERKEEVQRMYQEAAGQIQGLERDNKLTFVAAGLEHGHYKADMDQLQKLSCYPNRIIKISYNDNDNMGIFCMDRFFNLICEMTEKTFNADYTPVDDLIGDIFS